MGIIVRSFCAVKSAAPHTLITREARASGMWIHHAHGLCRDDAKNTRCSVAKAPWWRVVLVGMVSTRSFSVQTVPFRGLRACVDAGFQPAEAQTVQGAFGMRCVLALRRLTFAAVMTMPEWQSYCGIRKHCKARWQKDRSVPLSLHDWSRVA